MSESEERALRLLRAKRVITLTSPVVGYVITWCVANAYLSGPAFWLAMLLGGAFLTWMIYLARLAFSAYRIYKDDLHELGFHGEQAPEDDVGPTVINLEIVGHPENPVGRYMDHEFYEWLDFKSGDSKVRANFFGTVDLKREIYIPSGCVLLSPGILYELQTESAQVDLS